MLIAMLVVIVVVITTTAAKALRQTIQSIQEFAKVASISLEFLVLLVESLPLLGRLGTTSATDAQHPLHFLDLGVVGTKLRCHGRIEVGIRVTIGTHGPTGLVYRQRSFFLLRLAGFGTPFAMGCSWLLFHHLGHGLTALASTATTAGGVERCRSSAPLLLQLSLLLPSGLAAAGLGDQAGLSLAFSHVG